jgi:hypothetical protein
MPIEAGFGDRFEFADQLEIGKRFRHRPCPSSGATLPSHRSESGTLNPAGRACRRDYTFTGCGAFQTPLSASGFGQYSRSTSANGPFGAGSQLDSLSMPGDSFWMENV